MNISLRFAGAATLCAALLLAGCAKKTTDQTTSSTTTTTTTDASPAAAAPAAASSAADSSAATPGAMSVSVKTGAPAAGGANGFIDLPVYPGAAESKDQGMSVSANGGSLVVQVFSTKDDPIKVSDWYKTHLPASWKSGVMTSGQHTVGTFANDRTDGDQSVVVTNDDTGTTRIQFTTKHGK
jgi:hypothetical protein